MAFGGGRRRVVAFGGGRRRVVAFGGGRRRAAAGRGRHLSRALAGPSVLRLCTINPRTTASELAETLEQLPRT